MTKRIALAMLATVFAILIAAGVTAYLTTRSVLLANMDASMVERTAPVNESDRFVARNELGQKVESGTPGDREKYKPALQWARFVTLDDGTRVRTVSVRTFVRKDNGSMEPVTATLSEPAAPFDRLMNRLAWALLLAGCAGAAIAGVVARLVAQDCTAPFDIDRGHHRPDRRAKSFPANRLGSTRAGIDPVADRLNEMLARLEASFDNRRRLPR